MAMMKRREEEAAQVAANPPAPAEPRKLSTEVKDPGEPVYYITSGYGKPMTKYEIDKDHRISRAGVWQAAASNSALIGYAADVDALKKVIRELAEDGIKFINEGV